MVNCKAMNKQTADDLNAIVLKLRSIMNEYIHITSSKDDKRSTVCDQQVTKISPTKTISKRVWQSMKSVL